MQGEEIMQGEEHFVLLICQQGPIDRIGANVFYFYATNSSNSIWLLNIVRTPASFFLIEVF